MIGVATHLLSFFSYNWLLFIRHFSWPFLTRVLRQTSRRDLPQWVLFRTPTLGVSVSSWRCCQAIDHRSRRRLALVGEWISRLHFCTKNAGDDMRFIRIQLTQKWLVKRTICNSDSGIAFCLLYDHGSQRRQCPVSSSGTVSTPKCKPGLSFLCWGSLRC